MSKIPNVVIVGRTNVGKSTFFNRLSTDKKSIALDEEGITRDFIKEVITWDSTIFNLIDTGGIRFKKTKDPLLEKVRAVAEEQVKTADLVLFMCDGTVGPLQEDREIARFLRRCAKNVILIINKADSFATQANLHECVTLGFSNSISISAQHGTGIAEVLEAIIAQLKQTTEPTPEEKSLYSVVILGKPNVGKSSLMNLLAKQERSIILDMPGTTREALSQDIQFYNKKIELVDTPGIRRKRCVDGSIEPLMVKSAFAALKHADIVVLVIDASEGDFVDQELKLAFYAFEEQHKALIVLINKQDLSTEETQRTLDLKLDEYKYMFKHIPLMSISCITEKNTGRILPLLDTIWKLYSQQLNSDEVTKLFISKLTKKPLFHLSQKLVVYNVEQIRTAPITLVLTVNNPAWFKDSQLGFFENVLRSEYDLKGVPVKFIVRAKYKRLAV